MPSIITLRIGTMWLRYVRGDIYDKVPLLAGKSIAEIFHISCNALRAKS